MRLPTSVLRHGIVTVLAAGAIGLMLWPPASSAQVKLDIMPVAEKKLKELPAGPLYWQLETLATLGEAHAAAGPTSLAAEVAGKMWLFTRGAKGGATRGGSKVAEIGPVAAITAPEYLLRINHAGGPTGAKTKVHTHPGSEAFYVLTGRLGQRTPYGVSHADAGQTMNGQAPILRCRCSAPAPSISTRSCCSSWMRPDRSPPQRSSSEPKGTGADRASGVDLRRSRGAQINDVIDPAHWPCRARPCVAAGTGHVVDTGGAMERRRACEATEEDGIVLGSLFGVQRSVSGASRGEIWNGLAKQPHHPAVKEMENCDKRTCKPQLSNCVAASEGTKATPANTQPLTPQKVTRPSTAAPTRPHPLTPQKVTRTPRMAPTQPLTSSPNLRRRDR